MNHRRFITKKIDDKFQTIAQVIPNVFSAEDIEVSGYSLTVLNILRRISR